MKTAIGIIGCGWLGLPLAVDLVKDGYKVHGSTTSKEKIELLKESGIQPYLIGLSDNQIERGPLQNSSGR